MFVCVASLNSVAGVCDPALCPGLVLLLCLSWPCLELCGWSLWLSLLERSVAERITMLMSTKIIDEAIYSSGENRAN